MITIAKIHRNITMEPILVQEDERIQSVYHKLVMQKVPISRCAYVIDDDKKIVGMITLKKMMRYVAVKKALTGRRKQYSVSKLFEYTAPDLVARTIMVPPVFVELDHSIETAFQLLLDHDLEEAAVVNKDGRVVGDLNIYEVLQEINIDR